MHVYTDLYLYRSVSIYYALIEGGVGGAYAAAVLLCHPCAPTAYRPQRAPSVPAVGVAPCGWCNMSVAVAAVLLCHPCAPTAYRPQRAPSVPAAAVAPCGWCNMSVAGAAVVYATKNRLHAACFRGDLFLFGSVFGVNILHYILYVPMFIYFYRLFE